MEVPDYVADAARRGLEWHAEGKSGDGTTDQTIREARAMAGGNVSEDKLRRMNPWFQRHRPDMDAPKNKPDNEDFPGAGAVAWALWGGPTSGDIMRTAKWAEAEVVRLDREKEATANHKFDLSRKYMTIEEQLIKAMAELTSASAERDELRANLENAVAKEASDFKATLEQNASLVIERDALAKEKAELVAQIAELQTKNVSASVEAAKIASSVGVNPVELSPSDKSDEPAKAVNHLEHFLSLPMGAERSAYFAKHKNEIVRSI
jgi:hypothetical protein